MSNMSFEAGKHEFTLDTTKQQMWREIAYLDGCQEQTQRDRIAAFGAIRRAVEYARYHDQRADDWERNGVEDIANTWAFAAISIRRAIRAAIGSEKK